MTGFRTASAAFALAFALASALGACVDAPAEPTAPGGRVAISVAPLDLPGVTDARWRLTVTAGAQTVWARELRSSAYGVGAGSLSYVGTCDADAGANVVTLELLTLYQGGAGDVALDPATFSNPGPLTRTVTCLANADVPVTFDVTLARAAQQGFFDVAITFRDIFCSAKFDCTDALGAPLQLLSNGATRDDTAVLAFACTAGATASTVLYLSSVVVSCGAAETVINPTLGPGNLSAVPEAGLPNATLFEAAIYRGDELLGGYQKRYWNVALGLADVAGCTLTATATASDGAFTEGWTPAGTTWPYVAYTVDFDTCTRHALNAADGVVATRYTDLDGEQFSHYLSATSIGSYGVWWDAAWAYLQPLTVQAGATALTADATFTLTFDHAALVTAGRALANGNDLRLLYWDGAAYQPLDRFVTTAWNSATTTVAFSPVVDIASGATVTDYALAYGNPLAGAPPADPRAVYLLYDDFDDGDFTTGTTWTANHGTWSVVSGYARLVNPTGADGTAEAGLYYPGGAAWTDYELSLRLRDASTGGDSYPGPMLRVGNPAVSNTSMWWFEYRRSDTTATMRPYVNNTDYNWAYNVTLPTAFPSNTWVQGRYRVVGNQIWSWFDGTPAHVGVTVAASHVVSAGSVALGAHNGYPAPQDFHYDDVRVTKHLPNPPTITLGAVVTRP